MRHWVKRKLQMWLRNQRMKACWPWQWGLRKGWQCIPAFVENRIYASQAQHLPFAIALPDASRPGSIVTLCEVFHDLQEKWITPLPFLVCAFESKWNTGLEFQKAWVSAGSQPQRTWWAPWHKTRICLRLGRGKVDFGGSHVWKWRRE